MKSSICQNCIHKNDCLFLKANLGVISVFCEMHESKVKTEKESEGNNVFVNKSLPALNVDLCSTCEHRYACNWRQDKDFVFDCEEYE